MERGWEEKYENYLRKRVLGNFEISKFYVKASFKIPFPPLGRNSADFSKVFPRLALFARETHGSGLRFRFLITWMRNNEHCSIVSMAQTKSDVRGREISPPPPRLEVVSGVARIRWRKIKRQCAKSGEIRHSLSLSLLSSRFSFTIVHRYVSQRANFLPLSRLHYPQLTFRFFHHREGFAIVEKNDWRTRVLGHVAFGRVLGKIELL